jgi:hypothetical protein
MNKSRIRIQESKSMDSFWIVIDKSNPVNHDNPRIQFQINKW